MLNTIPVIATSAAYDAFIERGLARVERELDDAAARAELVDSLASVIERRKLNAPDATEFADALGAICDGEAADLLSAYQLGRESLYNFVSSRFRAYVGGLAHAIATTQVQRLDEDAQQDAASRGGA
ncbi:hypothetical protein WS87_08460 [Burkholderia sp. MSMB0856]|uniref:hypothetical protein n=1 Tax=Burkholderia sp. MSMB0856 TaxID=1637869 RepID=UPI00075A0F0F|nr:hypothetical protein [Burkholderia sp. MSMB0856]AOJ86700.1 hypothetical protein WS87_08460 [Burkholderia sp. MSMB0856]KVH38041.1 hypothetical protein WS87_00070 [Burkholderia sp. MSMB0856]